MVADSLSANTLHLIGCGKMGKALVAGWLKAGVLAKNISAQSGTASTAGALEREFSIRASTAANYEHEAVVIIAVKPQVLPEVIKAWRETYPQAKPLFISLAAGITLTQLKALLGEDARIIRAMPNTPALVGLGTTSLCEEEASEEDKTLTAALFSAVGKVHWMKNETELLAATALAGSGPAYVYYFAESLLKAAIAIGLEPAIAKEMVEQTLKGSIALAEKGDWKFADLRQNVTSKGGVTQAALEVLQKDDVLNNLLKAALEANVARSKSLS